MMKVLINYADIKYYNAQKACSDSGTKFGFDKVYQYNVNLNMYKASEGETLFLKYELFYNNYDYIYDEIQKYFDIELSDDERNEITEYVSLEKNKERSDKFSSFDEYDSKTHIHGKHIYHPEPGIWKEVLDEKEQQYITNLLLRFLQDWGYE